MLQVLFALNMMAIGFLVYLLKSVPTRWVSEIKINLVGKTDASLWFLLKKFLIALSESKVLSRYQFR